MSKQKPRRVKALLKKLGIVDCATFGAFVKQFVKFGIVGLSNTLISLGVYYSLVMIGLYYIAAHAIAFALSVLNAYYWSSKFVFKQSKGNRKWRLAKVYTVYGFTFLLSVGLLYTLVEILGVSELIAPLINLCITVPLNFLLNKFWAFR